MAAFSESLDEWTAAQITDLNPDWKTAGVLELNWSGPEPESVTDLGEVSALVLTHHNWAGRPSHCNYEWVLPRGYKVIGKLPLLRTKPSSSYSTGWWLGEQLARQRRWDRGEREPWSDPREMTRTGAEINQAMNELAGPRRDIRSLSVTEVESLDCDRLAEHFPALVLLSLSGNLGLLSQASSLNRLASLRRLHITDLFGMSKSDRLLPKCVPALELLCLHSVPHEYAVAMRATWRPEIPHGTFVEITAARKPEWVAENRANPLRDWDGREHISGTCYKEAVAQYKETRQAVIAVLSGHSDENLPAQLVQIGREYGMGFNELDRRTRFIATDEREELFAALDFIVSDAEATLGLALGAVRGSLAAGVDAVRDW
ncbi:hypothetical protein N5079_22970 [Planotetraspora sp. A-T 1434]|uniref:hypothetical protein n=1 Tax=Planotetraspora sp. A-T 1434 TaxID=2979219 RepID=UPI0021BF0947|nr:hypothetical protein [Planotetraspora sp. A-T 1434]MCT9933075.1 hypothetical protein [Planotetraspora sp. A-T 1434]